MILSLRIFLFFSKEHSELCDWEKDKKIPKRNIKHVKFLIFIVKGDFYKLNLWQSVDYIDIFVIFVIYLKIYEISEENKNEFVRTGKYDGIVIEDGKSACNIERDCWFLTV